jgi:LPS O-antigen subunit length determinant protein (WzzB/FepE family)
MWLTLLGLLKNKFVIYGVIALCCVSLLGAVWYRGTYYQGKLEALKIQHQAEKVALYEAFAKEAEAHNLRLVEIEKTSKDINQRIKGLKLEKEKCQSDDFYRLADDIVKRVRRR